jgi:hypothetical protein
VIPKARPEPSGTTWLKSPLRKGRLAIDASQPAEVWPSTVTGASLQRTT